MRKLVYFIAVTADGFIADSDGGFDFFPATGGHLDHLVAEYPETFPGHLRQPLGVEGDPKHFDTVLMGRETYEVGRVMGVSNPYPHLRQIVVSKTMTESPDPAVELTSDPVERVQALKREEGLDIWLCGGGKLAGALSAEIDEIVLKVNPVVIGNGRPLFDPAMPAQGLELASHQIFDGGVVILSYRISPVGSE